MWNNIVRKKSNVTKRNKGGKMTEIMNGDENGTEETGR
jgi:hypothetical protein